jgi:hypothetical protein
MDAEVELLAGTLACLANFVYRLGSGAALFFIEEPADFFHQLHEPLGVLLNGGLGTQLPPPLLVVHHDQ